MVVSLAPLWVPMLATGQAMESAPYTGTNVSNCFSGNWMESREDGRYKKGPSWVAMVNDSPPTHMALFLWRDDSLLEAALTAPKVPSNEQPMNLWNGRISDKRTGAKVLRNVRVTTDFPKCRQIVVTYGSNPLIDSGWLLERSPNDHMTMEWPINQPGVVDAIKNAMRYNSSPGPTLPETATAQPPSAEKPDWQKHLDWCAGNSDAGGSVDCVEDYIATYPKCYVSGGRSCLIGIARQSAHDNDCQNAFNLAQMCQCNNGPAAQQIKEAGMGNVCQYLGPPVAPVKIPQPIPSTVTPAPSTNLIPSFTATCVFDVQRVQVAWLDGVDYAFVDGAGKPKRQVIDQEIDFSPAPFKNCRGLLDGAVPLGTTRIHVRSVSLCTNLISGHQTMLINMLCPRDNPQ